MLRLNDIHCVIRGKDLLQLDHLHLQPGESHGVVGPNGAGKTTLFRVISGELPSTGQVLFHGQPLHDWPHLARARHLAVLPQASQLTFAFTASEVVALGLTPLSLSREEGRREIRRFMAETRCEHLAERPYPQLSGGEKQRVQLARVLLQLSQAEKPPLLLLDEPTSAQDLGQQHSLLRLTRQLCDKHEFGVLAILHDLNQVLHYCDRCSLIAEGKLVRTDLPEQLLAVSTVEDHWGYRPDWVDLGDGRRALI